MGMLDGLFNGALGGMMGQGGQGQNPMLQMALQVLQQNGRDVDLQESHA